MAHKADKPGSSKAKKPTKEADGDDNEKRARLPLQIMIEQAQSLALLLLSTETYVYYTACEALGTYGERGRDQRLQIASYKTLPPVIAMLASDQVPLLQCSTFLLSVVLQEVEIRREFRQLGGLKALVKLLDSGDMDVTDNTVVALGFLALEYSAAAEITKNGALENVLPLLSGAEPDVLQHAVQMVCNCALEYTSRAKLRELEAVPLLLALLMDGSPETQNIAAISLSRCSQDHGMQKALLEKGALQQLITVVGAHEQSYMHGSCAEVIANCLSASTKLGTLNITKSLLDLLHSDDPVVLRAVTKALANACKDDGNRVEIWVKHDVSNILKLLESDDIEVLKNICHLIAVTTENVDICRNLNREEVIPALVAFLEFDAIEVKAGALACLCSFSRFYDYRVDIRTHEGIQHLLMCLGSPDADTQRNAAECLGNLAQEHESRVVIRLLNGITEIVSRIDNSTSSDDARAAMARTLAACAHDPESRVEVRSADGVTKLMNLLNSSNPVVRRNVQWALSILAEDERNAQKICELGGIDTLKMLTVDGARASDTVTRILKHNLPVQYSATGFLDVGDVTGAGFYDAGRSQSAASLEDLRRAPVNARREVILINPEEDKACSDHVTFAMEQIKKLLPNARAASTALATYIAERMGGAVPQGKELPGTEYEIKNLKVKLQSNVVPIGMISRGVYYHRALLFKVMADCIGMPVTLRRGEYARAWNTVVVDDGQHVVDLMHDPGQLFPEHSAPARLYQEGRL